MPDITVRGVTLSAAACLKPHIIVPVMADSLAEAERQARALAALPAAGLVELRLDPLPAADRAAALAAVRGNLRADQPLLVTLRTAREGGAADLDPAAYAAAVQGLLAGPVRPDLIDIEFSAGADPVAALLRAAHAAGVRTVFSEHHFAGTPPQAEMASALCAMADAGADIVKLAVMAQSPGDAAALLAATAAAAAARPDTPRLTMAMGPHGAVTRVCGGAFGSCATFGAAGRQSAPGQPDAAALAGALAALEDCL